MIFTIVPFCPSVLWGQLIASHAGWRYVGLFCGLWAFVGLLMTLIFYFPPPRPNSQGLSRREVISRIDFLGGLLSVSGMLLFMAGLQWGGYQVRSSTFPSRWRHLLIFSFSIRGSQPTFLYPCSWARSS